MAIDLYTKQEETPIWKKILFIFSIVLTFIVIIIFAYNQFSKIPQNNKVIEDFNYKLSEQGTQEQLLEKEFVLIAEKKITDFKQIYNAKPVFNVFFDNFETWVYPRIFFSSSSINAGSAEVILAGETDSLQSVMQEMLLLDAQTDILSYTVSNINIQDNGKVTFDLTLNVKPELFKKDNNIIDVKESINQTNEQQ